MEISIVILNYKSRGLLKQCLKAIKLISLNITYEIIVVDNASGDGSVQMVKQDFPQVKIIKNSQNQGYAAGNNLGIKQAQGKFILVLNPDITVLDRAIEKMYHYMEEHQQVGILGPKLINPDGSTQMSCRTFPTFRIIVYRRTPLGKLPGAQKLLKKHLMVDFNHQQIRDVDWMLGACYLIRKEYLNQVGLFDERFFLYFEDVDLCRRFWQANYKVVYFPQVEMVHYHKRQSAINPGLKGVFGYATRVHINSGIKYFFKYLGKKQNNDRSDQ